MTTRSATNQHPYDLLEAFALDALEPEEEQAVTEHLDGCAGCAGIAESHLRTTNALAQAVLEQQPPERLRVRLLDSIDPPAASGHSVSVSVPRGRSPRSWSRVSTAIGSRWVRVLTPTAAVLAVALIAVTVGLNIQISGNLDNLQAENSQLRQRLDQSMATTTALARSSEAVSQMQGSLQQWQQTSYALAQPGNQTVVLSAARPGVDARGFLVVSGDGSAGLLMVSDLMPSLPDSVYHVWLTRGGQRFWAGEMQVDDQGSGAMQLIPSDPLQNYDSIQLSRGMGVAAALAAPPCSVERAKATAGMVGDMVLTAPLQ